MRFKIERHRWLRGEGGADSELLRESDGKMCCLGFYALALGSDENDIAGIGDPETAPSCSAWPEWLLQDRGEDGLMHTDDAISLIKINDEQTIGDAHREQRIASIFASHGVEVTFVDGEEPS